MTKKIGNEYFEVVDAKKAPKTYEKLVQCALRSEARFLNQIYDSYSSKKQAIYDYWEGFVYDNNGYKSVWSESVYGICSHNRNVFTLSFVIDDYGIFYITPSHNYLLVD